MSWCSRWRSYLWLTGCHEFRYNLFGTYKIADDGFVPIRDPDHWLSFSFFRYPNLEADVVKWVGDFLAWATASNLTQYLIHVE